MITVYSQPNCPHCDRVKNQLESLELDYTEINVRRDAKALDKITQDWGYSQVPVVEYDGDTILNPYPIELEDFLEIGSVFDEF